MTLQNRSSKPSNFLIFNSPGNISLRSVTFLFLIFVRTTLSSFCVNYFSLMSSWLLLNFRVGFICDFMGISKKILEMLFPHVYSFFLPDSFYFCSRGSLPFTHFIYCLPRYSRLSNFYRVSNSIDLTLNVFYLFFLVCVY